MKVAIIACYEMKVKIKIRRTYKGKMRSETPSVQLVHSIQQD